jgi:CheY-like chemotaxis protein
MYPRASPLSELGYEVVSVLGNDAATDVLNAWPHYDLFVIGPNAPDATRLQIVEFLRTNYPRRPIIALNPVAGMRLGKLCTGHAN